jgi:hypothetical protein
MSTKVRWFIAIGILLNVILCAGFYANYRLDQVVSSLNRPGVLFSEAQSDSGANGLDNGVNGSSGSGDWNKSWGDGSGNAIDGTGATGSGGDGSTGSGDKVNPPSSSDIASDVVNKIGRPVEKGDLVKAGLIILRRLNGEEISYLYHVGRKSSFSNEERGQVRKILLNKLNSDDIVTLKALGKKYGRGLSILDQ